MDSNRFSCVLVLTTLLLGAFVMIVPERAPALTPHDPIYIGSNAAFTPANGVTGGTGTPGDPYIIEGWEIDATNEIGIRIRNTDMPFIIRDVAIHTDGTNDTTNILLGRLQDGRVENATLTYNRYAVSMLITNNVTIMDSWISGDEYGLHIDRADNTTLVNNTIAPTTRTAIRLAHSENLTMSRNTITSDGIWIQDKGDEPSLYDSHTITPDNLVNGKPLYYHKNCDGLDIDGIPIGQLIIVNCTNVQVANVDITDTLYGIQMFYADGATISNSSISVREHAMEVKYSPDVTVSNMNIHDSGWGVYVGASDGFSVSNSTFTSTSDGGLFLGGSPNGTIEGNEFISSGVLLGLSLEDHDTLTIQDNTVNGEPLLYYRNCNGVDIDGVPVGQLIMVNCDDVRVANVDASDTTLGIAMSSVSRAVVTDNVVAHGTYRGMNFGNVDDFILTGNTVTSSGSIGIYVSGVNDAVISGNKVTGSVYDGIRLGTMENVTFTGNDFSNNDWNGISLKYAENVTIAGNVLSHNNMSGADVYSSEWVTVTGNRAFSNLWHGIYVRHTENSTVAANNVSSNGLDGIRLYSSADVLVHHNNIDNAPTQAYDDGANTWDDGYPSGGNYWTDYAGVDDCSGADQDICTGGDGIGDTNYTIDADSVDNYPLMAPYEDTEKPSVVILSPTEDESFDTVQITVTGTASDQGLSGLKRVDVRIYGEDWILASGTAFWSARITLTFGNNFIEARATDAAGNTANFLVNVTLTNEPPTASFTVSPASGHTTTEFSVDASGSSDPEDLASALEVRWDWEDDGTWDTAWSTNKNATHTYSSTGTYTIRLEVRDTGGGTNSTTMDVEVADEAEEGLDMYLILGVVIVLVVVIAVAAVLMRRRQAPPEEAPPEEEPSEDVTEEQDV